MLNPSPHLLAFGFLNAAILGWLAAAAAPILIHLWMKRVRRETPWAAVRFLRKAIERHSRRLRLREWLLLAVRTAIILCVVLAAAKPVLEGVGLAGPGVRTHRLLVIDTSLSMRYRPEEAGPSLLDEAKRLAAELVDDGRSGDVYSLIAMTQPPLLMVGQPVADRQRVGQAIESLQPTDGAAKLDPTLAMAQQLIERSREQTKHVDQHEVLIFSDLARHTWGAAEIEGDSNESGVANTSIASRIDSLKKTAALSVVDLGLDNAVNASVGRVEVLGPLPTAGRPLRLSAEARLHGPRGKTDESQTTAELLINGVSVASKPVRLAPDSATAIEFSHRFERPGPHAVEVRLQEDRLRADNSGWLGLTLPERTRVLCVAGGPGAARNVAGALRPFADQEQGQSIEPVVVSDAELASVDLSPFAAVFFCNVAQLSGREAERVEAYVRSGGGAAFFLGDRVVPEAYNRASAAALGSIDGSRVRLRLVGEQVDPPRLLPVTIGPSVASSSRVIDPLGYAHPIARPFEGRERAGLLTTPIARYWRLDVNEDADQAEVVFASSLGDPLLVTARLGRGRVAVMATAASLASVDPATSEPWTAMPAWPSFLPIVRGMLHNLAGGTGSDAAVIVGEPISGPAPAAARRLELLRPDNKTASITIGDDHSWGYPETDRAGVYQTRLPGGVDPLLATAVNTAASESDLTRVSTKTLPDGLSVRRVAVSQPATATLPTATGIHRTLLLAALALVLVETLLAYWYGRPTA